MRFANVTASFAFALSFLLAPMPANAQDDGGGDDVEMPEEDPDALGGGGSTGDENPGDPTLMVEEKRQAEEKAKEPKEEKVVKAGGYPLAFNERPLTLPGGMAQVSLDMFVNADPFLFDSVLGGQYGITDKLQIGLRYQLGSLNEDEYFESKATALDVAYKVFDWISVQLSVPMWLDPFAIGVQLGAPFQFDIGNLQLYGLHDLIGIKFYRFLPMIESALGNEALVAIDQVGEPPNGEIRVNFGASYQLKPATAVFGEVRQTFADFSNDDRAFGLWLGGVHSFGRKIDLGGRIGFDRMDEAKDSFGVDIFCRLRI
jgi:hypothetical protein